MSRGRSPRHTRACAPAYLLVVRHLQRHLPLGVLVLHSISRVEGLLPHELLSLRGEVVPVEKHGFRRGPSSGSSRAPVGLRRRNLSQNQRRPSAAGEMVAWAPPGLDHRVNQINRSSRDDGGWCMKVSVLRLLFVRVFAAYLPHAFQPSPPSSSSLRMSTSSICISTGLVPSLLPPA